MILHEGQGWRLQRDIAKSKFSFLIGTQNSAVELLEEEWQDFCAIVFDLINEHRKLEKSLMAEEEISLEIERFSWWACLDGNRENLSLKVIFSTEDEKARGFELFWPAPTAQILTAAMRTMWDS